MKSNRSKVQGLEKTLQHLDSIINAKIGLVLPTGETVVTDSAKLEEDVNEYITKEKSNLKHTISIDKTDTTKVVLMPIVESGWCTVHSN